MGNLHITLFEIKAHWNSSFLVYFLWISCLENRSKKVSIPVFAYLNMCEPALDEENRTVTTQYNVNTKSTGLFQKKSIPNRWHRWSRHGISKGIEENRKSQGSIKKEAEFSQECSRKTHVELLCGNQKNIWLSGLSFSIYLWVFLVWWSIFRFAVIPVKNVRMDKKDFKLIYSQIFFKKKYFIAKTV